MSPLLSAMPVFRAEPGPALFCRKSRNRGTFNDSTSSPLPSVDPSSTTMISPGGTVWLQIEDMAL